MKFKMAIPYRIEISASENEGFIVQVGCSRLCYTDKKLLLRDLEEYLNDPEKVEKLRNEDLNCNPREVVLDSEPSRS